MTEGINSILQIPNWTTNIDLSANASWATLCLVLYVTLGKTP